MKYVWIKCDSNDTVLKKERVNRDHLLRCVKVCEINFTLMRAK